MPFKVEDIDDFYYFQNRFEQLSRSKFALVFEDAEDTVMHSEVDAAIRINMNYDGVLLRIKITKDQWESETAAGNPYKKYLNLLHIRELPYACVYSNKQVVARYHGQKARDSFAKLLKFCAESSSKPPVVKSGVGQTIKGQSGYIKGSQSSIALAVTPRPEESTLTRERGSVSIQRSAAARSRGHSSQGLDKGKGPSSQPPGGKSKAPSTRSEKSKNTSEKSKQSGAAKSKIQPENSKISKPSNINQVKPSAQSNINQVKPNAQSNFNQVKPSAQSNINQVKPSAVSSIPKKSGINPAKPPSKVASSKNSQKGSKSSSKKPSVSSSNASSRK